MTARESILATLTYHDIFKYPLQKVEIYNLLVFKKCSFAQFEEALIALLKVGKIQEKSSYFFLNKSKQIHEIRKRRSKFSDEKRNRAKKYAKILSIIPHVKLVALTGALAMGNCTKLDDIDLLIITSKKRMWTTRFLANLILLPFKRSPNSKKQSDKACLNIFLDKSNLKIADQNLYTAHEIAQMVPIYNVNNTYKNFIKANIWIYKFLPNWDSNQKNIVNLKKAELSIETVSQILENLLKNFQLSYMKSKITVEKISNTQLFFHPKKTQNEILKKYNVLLKKVLS